MTKINKQCISKEEQMDKSIKFNIKKTFVRHLQFPEGLCSVAAGTLISFGDWLYKHLHTHDDHEFFLSRLLTCGLNPRERQYIWQGFEQNINRDFSELISFFLIKIKNNPEKYEFYPTEIINEYIAKLFKEDFIPDIKEYIQSCLAESTMLVIDDIVNEKLGLPPETSEHCKQLCSELKQYTDNTINTLYIEHLIGMDEMFSDIYDLIYNEYFNVEDC